ncbi:NUDIX hydrolase [Patescibacteria group bacterium]
MNNNGKNLWKKLDSKILFKHKRITLVEDTVEIPDGTKRKYLRYTKIPEAVSLICVSDKNEILLEKEYSYPPNKILIQLPGGSVEKSETVEEAANRELEEETGMSADTITKIGSYYMNNRKSNTKMHVCVCKDFTSKKKLNDPEEDVESFWVPERKVDELISKGEIENPHLLASWSIYKNS